AAGAIGSPQILQLSGIGPAALLSKNHIELVHDSPGVGENLQDHLQIRTVFKVTGASTLNERSNSLLGKLGIAAEYALRRSGPMSMAPSQLGIFARSSPDFETPNIEYHIQPLSLEAFGEPLHDYPAITISVCNLRPQSRGSTHICGPEPTMAPVINPNYLSTETDRRIGVDCIRHARALMATKAMLPHKPVETKPGAQVMSNDALSKAAGDIATTIFHPVGTTRMGVDSAAVVDPELRVNGIGNLRIADASIMPTIVSGNTHAPITMIAEKAASLVNRP
ncbi:MAG: GMC family oxidoreductase, partial [Hyphomicrobiales bacterium]